MNTDTATTTVTGTCDGSDESEPSGEPAHAGDDPGEPPSCTSIRLIDRSCETTAADRAWLQEHLHRVVPLLSRPLGDVTLAIVNDAAIEALHTRHLGIAGTTDVITFDLTESDGPVQAEVAICLDEARRQAAKRDHAIRRELLLYALHGLLHCCGFDDHDNDAFATMHAEEDRILREIGIGNTFASHEIREGNSE